MRRLEDLAGVELFEKTGRNAQLTEGGLVLLDYARQLLALNDEAVQAVSGLKVRGKIRLGMLQDFAETIRPSALASFSRAHPAVELEVRVERSTELLNALQRRDLIWSSCSGPRIRAKRSLPNRLEKYQWSGSGNIHPNRTKS
jgi:Transcriptional regulator